MSYGIEVFDSGGNQVIRIHDRLARLVTTRSIPEDDSGSEYLSLPTTECTVVGFLEGPDGEYRAPHKMSLDTSNGYLEWAPLPGWTGGPTFAMVFAYG